MNTSRPIDAHDSPALIDSLLRDGLPPGGLIALLQGIQQACGYLPEAALVDLAGKSGFSAARITAAATFYSQFRLRPAGAHTIKVCVGTACHVKGAPGIIEAFKRHLNIPATEDTDADGQFTVEGVPCLGCCMLAPAVQIDQVIYGPVAPRSVGGVIEDFLLETRRSAGAAAVAEQRGGRGDIRLCLCSSCRAAGADRVADKAAELIRRYTLPVRMKEVACTGISFETPLVEVVIDGDERRYRYGRVSQQSVSGLLFAHFPPVGVAGRLQASVARGLARLYDGSACSCAVDIDAESAGRVEAFTDRQIRIATAFSGEISPLDLADYRQKGGFAALDRCIGELSQEDVLNLLTDSGLKGRGGGGFPTAAKWWAVHRAMRGEGRAESKCPTANETNQERRTTNKEHGTRNPEPGYLICNADEGDPGAFMDRMMLESFPFRVIEGMAIAARTLGIREGFVYVRAEYPLAVERMRKAIDICETEGILRRKEPSAINHQPSAAFRLRIIQGAGAFVCGEETALIAAVEGGRGEPHLRPPYPAIKGLWGKPTLVNNVETFAVIPWIVTHGAGAFAALGTPSSTGTKTFALAGKVRRGGLVEVPMGMTIREIVNEIGGGVPAGRVLKAVQIGGPSGGCVPAALADTPVDYSALKSAGAMMGSGGLVVLDNTDCMVDVARYFMAFVQAESCGKCTCCRVGTWEMLAILERLCSGAGRTGDIEELTRLAHTVKSGSLCGLGKTAPNPVLSTLEYFADEYEAHLAGRCPAGKCRALIHYTITDRCIGCTRCAQVCPSGAIQPAPYRRHAVDDALCVRCNACRDVCPASAVQVQ